MRPDSIADMLFDFGRKNMSSTETRKNCFAFIIKENTIRTAYKTSCRANLFHEPRGFIYYASNNDEVLLRYFELIFEYFEADDTFAAYVDKLSNKTTAVAIVRLSEKTMYSNTYMQALLAPMYWELSPYIDKLIELDEKEIYFPIHKLMLEAYLQSDFTRHDRFCLMNKGVKNTATGPTYTIGKEGPTFAPVKSRVSADFGAAGFARSFYSPQPGQLIPMHVHGAHDKVNIVRQYSNLKNKKYATSTDPYLAVLKNTVMAFLHVIPRQPKEHYLKMLRPLGFDRQQHNGMSDAFELYNIFNSDKELADDFFESLTRGGRESNLKYLTLSALHDIATMYPEEKGALIDCFKSKVIVK